MIIRELSILAEKLLSIHIDFVELSDDWTIDSVELRDEIKFLAARIIDEAEKLKKLDY